MADLLAKESEKWNSGQQRRGFAYVKPETMNFISSGDDHTVYCTNSTVSPPVAACSEQSDSLLCFDALSWEPSEAPVVAEKKKGPLDHLLIDIDTPSLDSLLM